MIANLRPSGEYLMEDFYYAGGLPALMSVLRDHLDLDAATVSGKPLGDAIAEAKVYNDEVIRPLDRPISTAAGVAILRGNLAPDGAVMKPVGGRGAAPQAFRTGAGLPRLQRDGGELIDRDDLEVTREHVLVLQNAGPVGGPGMPEWGMLPIPKKLLKQGVRDMVRISDARMSGTSYGACILHVAPESYIGGPLAAVRNGDIISLDVEKRSLATRGARSRDRAAARRMGPPDRTFQRGYNRMYAAHITQADKGCDFDFLEGTAPTPEPEIH